MLSVVYFKKGFLTYTVAANTINDVMLQHLYSVRSCGKACFDCQCIERGRGCTGRQRALWENFVRGGQLCGDTYRSGEGGLLVSSDGVDSSRVNIIHCMWCWCLINLTWLNFIKRFNKVSIKKVWATNSVQDFWLVTAKNMFGHLLVPWLPCIAFYVSSFSFK